jgi:hypothetical protein
MNSKFYVSLEAEELLEKKGYPVHKDIPIYNEYGDITGCYPADRLTKAEAIDWLESKGIGISIIFCEIEMYEYVIESKDCYYNVVESGYKETRLEAEEAAIIQALEIL